VKTATLNLVALPKYRQLMCAHFDSIESAMKVIAHLLEFEPAAIELIDKATLDGTKANLQQQANRFWIEAEPEAVLVCEWFAEDLNELNHQMLTYQAWLLQNHAYAAPIIDAKDSSKVWEVRKAGLGMLMGKVTRKKAVAVIEDAAVPVRDLYDYFTDVQALMAELHVGCVYYGHASVGLIHIRPELDLATKDGKQLFQTIAERNSKLVKKYRGAISGEHGDGRIRAPFIKEQVGEQVYAYLLELKRAFDPHNLLNPGVIIGDMSITQNLRADRQPKQLLSTAFDWSKDLSLMDAVEKCNGAGACRKSAGRVISQKIMVAQSFKDKESIKNLLSEKFSKKISIITPTTKERKKLIDICKLNANEILKNQKSTEIYQKIKEYFKLSNTPYTIEVFDTSHMQSQANVGSKIVWSHDKFKKDEYRHYNLESKDEYSQMRELLTKRAESFDKLSPPDLWLIDGGLNQIKIAKEIIDSTGIDIDILGIAKEKIDKKAHRAKGSAKDKIYSINDIYQLNPHSPILQFLQKLRDEAHRFAITFHRKQKIKQDKEIELLKIKGIGKAKTIKLLNYFGTFENIKNASFEELSKVIDKESAKKIKNN
jgi:hypothetical protein